MKRKHKYLLIACIAILLVDVIGSVASRQLDFNYTKIWPTSLAVYAVLGFMLAKNETLLTTAWLTALLGVFDATIGWKVSILLDANTGGLNNHPSQLVWAITIVGVAIYAAVVGLISGGIAKLLAKRKAK
jgi:cell shape-determining protein MreD